MPYQSTGNGNDGGGLFVCLSFARVMMLLVGWLASSGCCELSVCSQ